MSDTPYNAYPNTFRHRLRAGEQLIGCWCSLANPITTEVLGLAGFDWILLDGEHSPNNISTFVLQLMALKGSSSAPVVRPPSNDPVVIKQLLDGGFHNFLIPFVESAEEARRAVAATRYPPEGIRGVSVSTRHNNYGTVPDYFKVANQNIALAVQIESRAGADAIEAIAAVDGVDAIFIGPSDLAAGLGHIGNAQHPEVQQVIAAVMAGAARQRKTVGILAPVEADARRYMQMGASFVAVGSDLGAFRSSTQALHDRYRSSASS
jgi:2-dehydro-3-deoxyglucarate aldolase